MSADSSGFRRTLVTAALPYANGDLHLGHIAGAYLPPDIYVRWLRLRGREVLFICGTDEYGVPIQMRAEQLGIPPGRPTRSPASASTSTTSARRAGRCIPRRARSSSSTCTGRGV